VLSGTADVEALATRAPTIAALDTGPVSLQDVEVLQAAFEQPYSHRQPALPPGLHPTTPSLLILLAWKVADSPWGPFAMAQVRVSCRSGVRPRGYVAGGVIDNQDAAAALAGRFGLPGAPGEVRLLRRYDAIELTVTHREASAARLTGLDPDPLNPGDVQFSISSTLARTPRGLRLVQVEPEYELRRVERIRARLEEFDATAWGQPMLRPTHSVTAIVAVGNVTIPPLRYVSRPDVSAFEGTEKL
jgi:hypothetical protein